MAVFNYWLIVFFICIEFSRVKTFAPNHRYDTKNIRSSRKSFDFAQVSTMESVYSFYELTYLAHIWPQIKDHVVVKVEPTCWHKIGVLFEDLLERKMWAYKVVDASGRYEAGLFEGNSVWLGSKAECLSLNNNYRSTLEDLSQDLTTEGINDAAYFRNYPTSEGDWQQLAKSSSRRAADMVGPPFLMQFYSVRLDLNVSKPYYQNYDITLGLCLPQTCEPEDVRNFMEFSIRVHDTLKTNKTLPRATKVISVRTVLKTYNIFEDPIGLLLIVLTAALIVIILIATAIDFELLKFKPNFKSMSFDLNPEKTTKENKKKNSKNEIATPAVDAKKFEVPIHRKSYDHSPYNEKAIDVDMTEFKMVNFNRKMDMKRVFKPDIISPTATLEVISLDETINNKHKHSDKHINCNRCGKYKKQCKNQTNSDSASACPRMKESSVNIAGEAKEWNKYNFLKSLILCFSLRASWKRLSYTNLANKNMSSVHLMKVLVVFWIVYVEVVTVLAYVSNNTGAIHSDSTTYNSLSTGSIAFDCLFFISGVLSTHHFFYLKSRYSVMELVNFGGFFGYLLQFICFVTNRAARLLPAYLFTILLTSLLSSSLLQTSPITYPESDPDSCALYWWRNLFFVNTFYPDKERCMQISWFLSLETQLHAAVTLLLCFGQLRVTTVIGACAVLAALCADVTTAYRDSSVLLPNPFAAYELLINRPWSRVAPYFIGTLTGWILHRLDGKLDVSSDIICLPQSFHFDLLYAACIQLLFLTFFTMYTTLLVDCCLFERLFQSIKSLCFWTVSLWGISTVTLVPWCVPSLGAIGDSLLSCFSHIISTAALIWPTVVFATKCSKISSSLLNNPGMSCLSRLSYCVILLHGLVVRQLAFGPSTALTLHSATLWSFYCGALAATWLCSLLLSMLIETPCCSLLRTLSDCASS